MRAGSNFMYGNTSRTADVNSGFVACRTTNDVVSANPVVSTMYCAFTKPWTCFSRSLSGYAGAALLADRTTATSTSSTE